MNLRTEQERRLVAYTQERYGEMLSLFLLSGLGEKGRAGARYFTVSEMDWDENIIRRRLVLSSDSEESLLPHGRDPLVFAVILKLLREQRQANWVRFRLAELMTALGWSDPVASGRAVAGAIGRYYATTLASLRLSGEPLSSAPGNRILIEHATQVTEGEGLGRTHFAVALHPDLALWLRHRILLGIDWKRVVTVFRSDDTHAKV